jgi:hypothetical protein
MANRRLGITLGGVALFLATLSSAVCQAPICPADFIFSEVTLTLHLPPEHDVAMPETVKVCQVPKCETGTLPPVGVNGAGFDFGPPFSDRGANDRSTFAPAMASGSLSLNPGDVRVLIIRWPIVKDDAFNPAFPQNTYDVDVQDANGVETGKLFNQVIQYTHISDPRCGVDAWTGSASD